MGKNLKYYLGLPYRMAMEFDRESNAWVIRYPELPGCTAHGSSPAQAIAQGREAKALWLETALEEGQTIPEPRGEPAYSGKLVLRLPKSLHEAAVASAEREGVSLNTYLIEVVSAGVERSGMKQLVDRIETSLRRVVSVRRVPHHERTLGELPAPVPGASRQKAC